MESSEAGSDDDDAPMALPEPAPNVLALEAAEECFVGPHTFLVGPLVLTSIDDGGSIDVSSGHPAEASSRTLCHVKARELAPGGMWVGPGTYLISDAETQVRARFPRPYVLELSAPRPRKPGQRESTAELLARLLERFGVEVLASKVQADQEDVTVEVPLAYCERMFAVLDDMDITVVSIRSQLEPPPPNRRHSHLRSAPDAPADR